MHIRFYAKHFVLSAAGMSAINAKPADTVTDNLFTVLHDSVCCTVIVVCCRPMHVSSYAQPNVTCVDGTELVPAITTVRSSIPVVSARVLTAAMHVCCHSGRHQQFAGKC